MERSYFVGICDRFRTVSTAVEVRFVNTKKEDKNAGNATEFLIVNMGKLGADAKTVGVHKSAITAF